MRLPGRRHRLILQVVNRPASQLELRSTLARLGSDEFAPASSITAAIPNERNERWLSASPRCRPSLAGWTVYRVGCSLVWPMPGAPARVRSALQHAISLLQQASAQVVPIICTTSASIAARSMADRKASCAVPCAATSWSVLPATPVPAERAHPAWRRWQVLALTPKRGLPGPDDCAVGRGERPIVPLATGDRPRPARHAAAARAWPADPGQHGGQPVFRQFQDSQPAEHPP